MTAIPGKKTRTRRASVQTLTLSVLVAGATVAIVSSKFTSFQSLLKNLNARCDEETGAQDAQVVIPTWETREPRRALFLLFASHSRANMLLTNFPKTDLLLFSKVPNTSVALFCPHQDTEALLETIGELGWEFTGDYVHPHNYTR